MSAVLLLEGVELSYPRPRRTLAERLGLRSTGRALALAGVDLEVGAGEAVGVVGDNGAGKTTLLRAAAGVLGVDRGRVGVTPRARALLELGAGFDPSRSGWDNACFLAAMLGVSQRCLEEARAEVEDMAGAPLEAPTRTYSQGMVLRLAFAVSVLDAPELLLVDEAFLVGDLGFRARAREQIHALRAGGTALLLAGHDHELIRQECGRCLWLEAGGIRAQGDTDAVLDAYHAHSRGLVPSGGEDRGPVLVGVTRPHRQGPLRRGDGLLVDLHLGPGEGLPVDVGVRLFAEDGVELWGGCAPEPIIVGPTGARLRLELPALPISPGRYGLEVGLADPEGAWCRRRRQALCFQVVGPAGGRGRLDLAVRWSQAGGERQGVA